MLVINSLFIVILASVVSCHLSYRDLLDEKLQLPKQTIITRNGWGACNRKLAGLVYSNETVSHIEVRFTNSTKCHRKLECIKTVKLLQQQFMDKQFYDTIYNFLIDPMGNVYEGLGWFYREPNMTIHNKQYRHSIGLIGLINSKLTPKHKEALKILLRDARQQKILNTTYEFFGTLYLQAMNEIRNDLQNENQVEKAKHLWGTRSYDNFERTTSSLD